MRGNETDRNVVSKRMDSKQVQETSHPPEQQKSQFAPQEAFQSMLQPGASTKGSVLLGSECEKFDSPPTGPTHSSPSLSDLIRQSEVSDVSNKPRTSPSEFTGISFTRPRPAESSTPPSLGDLIRQKHVSETNSTVLARPQVPPTEGSNNQPKSSMPSLSDLIGSRHSVMPPSLTTSSSDSTDFSSVLDESKGRLSSGSVSRQHVGGAANAKIQLKSLTRGSPGTSPSLAELMTSSKGMCSSDTGSTLPNKPRGNQGKVGAERTPGITPSLADLIRESTGSGRNQEGTKVPSEEVRGSGGGKVPSEEVRGSGGDKVPSEEVRGSGGNKVSSEEVRGSGGDKVPSAEVRGSGGNKVPNAEVRGSGGDKVPSAEVRGSGGDEVPRKEVRGSGGDKVPRKEVRGSGGDKVPRKEVRGSGGDEVQTSIYLHPFERKLNSKRGESHGTSLSLADLISKEVSDIDRTGKECTHPRLSDLMVLDKESTGGQTGKETTPPSLEDLMQKRQHQPPQSPHLRGLNAMQSPVAAPSLADLMSKNVESKAVLSQVSPSPHPPATVKGRTPITEPLSPRNHAPHTPAPTLVDLMRSSGTSSGDQIMEKGPHSLTDLMGVKTTQSDMTFLGSTPSSATIGNTALSSAPLTPFHHLHHDMATLFGTQRNVGNKSAHSEVHSVVLLHPNNASPTALVVSRKCNSISDRHRSIEAAILKSFCKDWYGGKLQPFSFTTPSPDDVIHNRQKGHIR